jgi:hypothetical protein
MFFREGTVKKERKEANLQRETTRTRKEVQLTI